MISKKFGLFLAWITACMLLIVSFYVSEVINQTPCKLCWYQRMALFPLSLILGIGMFMKDRRVTRYSLPFSLIGLGVALYHVTLQEILIRFASFEISTGCSEKKEVLLGCLSMPMFSAIGFCIISLLLYEVHRVKRH